MGIIEFGTALIKSEDLDPMYCAVTRAGLDDATLSRLMLAYVCLYHLGAAAKIAEYRGAKFWDTLRQAAENEDLIWPRGSERRHWRAANAVNSFLSLKSCLRTPEHAFQYWGGEESGDVKFSDVSNRVQQFSGFGPWIAFKIADICERVMGYSIDFSNCELGIYKDPRQGAAVAFLEAHDMQGVEKPWEYQITDAQLRETVAHYVRKFKKFKAPPSLGRPVNVQEIETVFCKYKSHLKGHYELGKDTKDIYKALVGWGDLADQIRNHMPTGSL